MLLTKATTLYVRALARRCPDFPDAPLSRATSFAVCAALRRCGLFELHSAGVTSLTKRPELDHRAFQQRQVDANTAIGDRCWRYLSDDELAP